MDTVPGFKIRPTQPESSGIIGNLFEISFFSNSSKAVNTWILFMSNAISLAVNPANHNGLRYSKTCFSNGIKMLCNEIIIPHRFQFEFQDRDEDGIFF